MRKRSLARRSAAEFFGTLFLVAAVIGSGIMAERWSNGNVALALLANTIATGAALVVLILAGSAVRLTILLRVMSEENFLGSKLQIGN